MDWDKFKENQDLKVEKEQKIKELKNQWSSLNQKCQDLYKKFDELTIGTKKNMENEAIEDFKNYFLDKDFNVTGSNDKFSAVYIDSNIIFSINNDFAYAIHFYVGQDMPDCKVFTIEIAKEFNGKYKQLLVEKIEEDSTLEFAENQIKALQNNISSIQNLINDIHIIKFVFELDSHYSGMSGQYSNIKCILDTLKA